jgi:hypothetical protein
MGSSPIPMPDVPSALRDSLFILDTNKSDNLLPSLHHIPALVIDCDDDVDVENDVDYKNHVGEQVCGRVCVRACVCVCVCVC